MKKKIIFTIIFIIIIVILIICSVSTEIENNVENIPEIEPEEEISEEEMRQTKVELYFVDKTSGILSKEDRKIDSKDLLDNPYKYIIQLLINGPESEGLENPIPEGTKINNVTFSKGVLTVDLSSEFLNSSGTDSIYSIVDSLTQFTEINEIKFLIDGEVKEGLKNSFIKE